MKSIRKHIVTFITFSRIPVAFIFFYIIESNTFSLISVLFACFIYIELSDLLDGFLARKLHAVSDLGKVLDPAADVTSHFLCILAFSNHYMIPKIVLLVFVLREYWILLLRSQLIRQNIVLAAGILGKIKTVLYAIAIISTLIFFPSTPLATYLLFYKPILNAIWYTATIVSIISALHYAISAYKKMQKKTNNNKPSTNIEQSSHSEQADNTHIASAVPASHTETNTDKDKK